MQGCRSASRPSGSAFRRRGAGAVPLRPAASRWVPPLPPLRRGPVKLARGRTAHEGRAMKHPTKATREGATKGEAYAGPERRRHRVYVTRNTEYHVRDRTCVAVRDRRTGDFMQGHLALERQIEGGLRFF